MALNAALWLGAPGVSWLRTFERCADEERKAALGMCASSDICFLPR